MSGEAPRQPESDWPIWFVIATRLVNYICLVQNPVYNYEPATVFCLAGPASKTGTVYSFVNCTLSVLIPSVLSPSPPATIMFFEEPPGFTEVRSGYGDDIPILTSLVTIVTTGPRPPSLAHFHSAHDDPDMVGLLELFSEHRRNFDIGARRRIALVLFLAERLWVNVSSAPKKHATESAIANLKKISVKDLREDDRKLPICTEEYHLKPVGPCSPYVEDVEEEECGGDMKCVVDDKGETPLRMPCGHTFGSTCLKTWLRESPACPLCREEVESCTDEPARPLPIEFDAIGGLQAGPNLQPFFPGTLESILTFLSHPRIPSPSLPTDTTTPSAESPYVMQSASIAPRRRVSRPSVFDRPDLRCAQAGWGLCIDGIGEPRLRLGCGHAFHEHCLEQSMIIEGYTIDAFERRCPSCRKWYRILQ